MKAKSAMEAAKSAPKPKHQECTHGGKCFGACPCPNPQKYTKEHDTLTSRTTGKKHEIMFGPQSNGLVPANPFASIAQEGYLHAHPEKLGKAGLKEWDAATKGKKLPEHVK